jgi:oxygen-dependent protoporphyrinogen oxidase
VSATDCDVLVIGAGATGLTCGYALHRRGCDVRVVDAGDEPGGVIRSVRVAGYLLERGPNSTLNTSRRVEAWLAEVGALAAKCHAPPAAARRYILRDGHIHPLPDGPLAFLKTPVWRARGKLRAMAEPFIPRRKERTDESIADFVRRRLGKEILDYALDPFVSGVYAGDPERISMGAAFPLLDGFERDHGGLIRGTLKTAKARKSDPDRPADRSLYSFREGMQQPMNGAATALGERLHLGRTVRHVVAVRGGFRVDADGDSFTCRRLVCATSALAAGDLLTALAPEAAVLLRAIEHNPVAQVYLGYRREAIGHPLDGFGALFPSKEGLLTLGSLWSSTLFPGRAPEGFCLLTNFAGGARHPEIRELSPDEIQRRVIAELEPLLELHGPPAFAEVHRLPQAIPHYTLGHTARLQRILAEVARFPDLHLTGNYLQGVSVADCWKRGLVLADRLATEATTP